MRGISFAAIVLLTALMSGTSQAQSVHELLAQCADMSDPPRSVNACTVLIQLTQSNVGYNKDKAGFFNNRGLAYEHEHRYDRAITDFDQSVQLDPNDAIAFFNRGIAYFAVHQSERAVQDYSEALKLKPDLYAVYNNRGAAYRRLGQYDHANEDFAQAIRYYDQLLSREPTPDPALLTVVGDTYNNMGQYDRAIESLDKAIKMKPDYANAWNGRCLAHERLGQLQQALADCNEAIRLSRSGDFVMTTTLSVCGYIYLRMKNYDAAIADFDATLKADPNSAAGSLYGRGLAEKAKGDIAGANTDIAAAKSITPNIADLVGM